MTTGTIPPSVSLPWRTGGPGGRIVYAQAGEQASDSDEIQATFMDPAVADEAVRRWNGALAGL